MSWLRTLLADAEDARHHPAHLGGGVELPLALAALGGEVAHQVFVGVAEDVVALGAVAAEVQRRVLEDGDQVGEPIDHPLAAAELGCVGEIGQVGEAVLLRQRADDLLVDPVADVALALEGHHVAEACPRAARERIAKALAAIGTLSNSIYDPNGIQVNRSSCLSAAKRSAEWSPSRM
ncbi:hypothetical protein JCM17961_41500 [Endothiovibrio diazotrophicus]